jgi:hypothetical protein
MDITHPLHVTYKNVRFIGLNITPAARPAMFISAVPLALLSWVVVALIVVRAL